MQRDYVAAEARALRSARSRGAVRQGDPRYTAYLFAGRQLDFAFWGPIDPEGAGDPARRAPRGRSRSRGKN